MLLLPLLLLWLPDYDVLDYGAHWICHRRVVVLLMVACSVQVMILRSPFNKSNS